MNWNDYEAVWKRQDLPVGASADLTTLKSSFETKRRKLNAALLVRDYTEATAGILGSIAFGLIWWQQGRDGWPIGLAILLMLGVSAVFVRERFRARRSRLTPDASLLDKLSANLAELRRLRHLTLTLWWWYLGPILVAMIIVGRTITHNRPPWDISRDPVFVTGYWIINAFFFWFAWAINHRALRKRIDPRIAELEKLRAAILADR